jgi:glycosyltransferase involved in cell wall biosynthesis
MASLILIGRNVISGKVDMKVVPNRMFFLIDCFNINQSMMKMTQIIVAVPTYNRAELLNRVLKSVTSQSFRDWQILFVDDASSDHTPATIAEFQSCYPGRIHYRCMEKNSGVNAVRNRIVEEVLTINKEAFVVWIDDDDYLAEECLEKIATAIKRNPGYNWYSLDCQFENGKPISKISRYGEMNYLNDYMFGKRMRGDMTHVVKADAIGNSRFTTQFRNAEVWYFWCQLAEKMPLFAVNEVGSIKEFLPDGITQSGFNRDKAIQVLQLKIDTLKNMVDEKKLVHQYVSLAKLLLAKGKKTQARKYLLQAWRLKPGYVRQYRYWLKILFSS